MKKDWFQIAAIGGGIEVCIRRPRDQRSHEVDEGSAHIINNHRERNFVGHKKSDAAALEVLHTLRVAGNKKALGFALVRNNDDVIVPCNWTA